jgi:hypothetical protein
VKPKNAKPLPPLRVRRELPTLEEAIFAAQGLTDDLGQQAEIAAALMNLAADEIRPQVAAAAAAAARPRREAPPVQTMGAGGRAVVVERQPSRRLDQRVRTYNLSR